MTGDTNHHIAVIGLGYVGLPLALAFADKYPVTGFDIDSGRVAQLQAGDDCTQEIDREQLLNARHLTISTDEKDLAAANIYIVTVPTPVDNNNCPNLDPLRHASATLGRHLKAGDIVVYESTVYPGATEEVCIPAVEASSGLRANVDFFYGYSPERINPGDRQRGISDIVKITSGSTPATADTVDELYRSIIHAGTHRADSIRVAEAAKVIENTQRDVNIALVNELASIFSRLDIDTEAVLEAAGSKWNFLPFRPGLVGGHCIGVDPYYLVNRAMQTGFYPELISAARRINDTMGERVAREVMGLMTQRRIHIVDSRILIMGLAFKENCPDLRNTKVADIARDLMAHNALVDIHDPWVEPQQACDELQLKLIDQLQETTYDAVIVAVAHRQFAEMGIDAIKQLLKPGGVIYDIKYVFPADQTDGRL